MISSQKKWIALGIENLGRGRAEPPPFLLAKLSLSGRFSPQPIQTPQDTAKTTRDTAPRRPPPRHAKTPLGPSGVFLVRVEASTFQDEAPRLPFWNDYSRVMFGYVGLCSVMFSYVRLCSVMFGYVRLCSVMFGDVRLCSVMVPMAIA